MKKLLIICLMVFAISCTPKISYLGDTFAPSTDIKVYYDQGDIKREYKVMGLMTADSFRSLESIKEEMIQSAKAKGADGILFGGFYEQPNSFDVEEKVVEGKLLKFRN